MGADCESSPTHGLQPLLVYFWLKATWQVPMLSGWSDEPVSRKGWDDRRMLSLLHVWLRIFFPDFPAPGGKT